MTVSLAEVTDNYHVASVDVSKHHLPMSSFQNQEILRATTRSFLFHVLIAKSSITLHRHSIKYFDRYVPVHSVSLKCDAFLSIKNH